MDISNLLKKNWVYIYSRRMTYQKARLYYYGFSNGIFGCNLDSEIYRYKNGDMFNYHDKAEEDKFSKYLIKKLLDKKFVAKNLKNLEGDINKDFNGYLVFLKSIPGNLENLSNAKLCSILNRYYKKENELSIRFWTLFGTVEVILIEAARKLLAESGRSAKESEEIISELSTPIKIIPLDMERLSLLEVALKEGAKQKAALQKHFEEFSYFPMYDIDYAPYGLDHFKSELKKIASSISKAEIKKEIVGIRKKYSRRYKQYLKTINKFKKNQHLLYILKFFAAYGYLKDFKPYVRDKGSFYIRRTFEEVARRLHLSLTEVLFLTEKEIPVCLAGKITVSKDELKKRMNNSACVCSGKRIAIVTDKNIIARIDGVLEKKEEVRELKGAKASAGVVSGRVRIVLSNKDFASFKEGEILVTSATRPDFVPLMKKAGGIVTDEGGMLSHAAIVSRELGKPCVVGTIKGTRILRNGDLVEVDADKGIVRKI